MAVLIEEIFSRIRPVGFGGLLGAGLMGLSYIIFKEKIPADIPSHYFLTVGGLVGAGFNRLLCDIYGLITCGSIGNFVVFFERLVQLFIMRPIISNAVFESTAGELAKKVVLERKLPDQLPVSDQASIRQLEAQSRSLQTLTGQLEAQAQKLVVSAYQSSTSEKMLASQISDVQSLEAANRSVFSEVIKSLEKEIPRLVEQSLSAQAITNNEFGNEESGEN